MTINSLLGKQLDEYRLEKLLGHGGMAQVYRAYDTRLNRYVAIKVISAPFREESEYEKRFEKEVQAIAQLNHPNIVTIYRYNKVDGILYMAMQYIEGADLEKIMVDPRTQELLPIREVYQIVRQLCHALDYTHQHGIIHRDVKPSNVMVDETGRTFLTDFGLALLTEFSTMGEVFGSPQYIAPEQAISSAGAVSQSDYYSLGVILYEMLTGRLPFTSENPIELSMQHMSMQPPPLRQVRPDLDPALDAVVLKLLAKDPSQRYPDGQTFLVDFEAAIVGMPEPTEQMLRNRVALALEENPLPPIPEAATPRLTQTIPTEPAFRRQLPLFMLAGAVMMVLAAACLAFLLINLSGKAELSALNDKDEPQNAEEQDLQESETSPTSLATGDYLLLQNGVGLTNGEQMNDGNFQVEGYCHREGYSSVNNDGTDWYCNRRGGQRYKLTQTDYDRICQLTYSNDNAIAMNIEDTSTTFAYNWRCFGQ